MPNKRIINLIISVILFFCVCSVSMACAEDGNGAGVGGKNKVSECISNPEIEVGDGCDSVKTNMAIESCSKPEKATVEVNLKETCGRIEEKEKKCNKGEEKAVPEVNPEETCVPVEKEEKRSESEANIVVSPEESGTGVSEGIVSHGRSENYYKVKIIPVANLSSGVNLTIEKPFRYVAGNIVGLAAGTNLTGQREAVMGFEFTWKIYGEKSFYLESISKYRTVFLPYGDYVINLTVIDKKGREISVGKVVTVVRKSNVWVPECDNLKRCGRENVGCDSWGGDCFLLCYKNFKFVGVSWVPREGVVGYEKSGPKQCFVRKALSRILGEGYRNKNNLKVDSLIAGEINLWPYFLNF